jgi:hypothetical protein
MTVTGFKKKKSKYVRTEEKVRKENAAIEKCH